jgi:hypothetical protein
MERFSKPLGRLMDFKQDFFDANRQKLEELTALADLYRAQPRRTHCKNCAAPLEDDPHTGFVKSGIRYVLCPVCGHCNGAHEDTDAFCQHVYTGNDGQDYARAYAAEDRRQYERRVEEVYVPKALFLREALEEQGEGDIALADFGAGAGYFVAAALRAGFENVRGFEPSTSMAQLANAMIGRESVTNHELEATQSLMADSDARVVSLIGVLEHLQHPREALGALRGNENVEYLYLSVPLFSPSVVLEAIFPKVMPRHLAGGHTHLYTDGSIRHFSDEFGFERVAAWWFGLDICDLGRSMTVSLHDMGAEGHALRTYWDREFNPLIDRLQAVLDEARVCSEVHVLLRKRR